MARGHNTPPDTQAMPLAGKSPTDAVVKMPVEVVIAPGAVISPDFEMPISAQMDPAFDGVDFTKKMPLALKEKWLAHVMAQWETDGDCDAIAMVVPLPLYTFLTLMAAEDGHGPLMFLRNLLLAEMNRRKLPDLLGKGFSEAIDNVLNLGDLDG